MQEVNFYICRCADYGGNNYYGKKQSQCKGELRKELKQLLNSTCNHFYPNERHKYLHTITTTDQKEKQYIDLESNEYSNRKISYTSVGDRVFPENQSSIHIDANTDLNTKLPTLSSILEKQIVPVESRFVSPLNEISVLYAMLIFRSGLEITENHP